MKTRTIEGQITTPVDTVLCSCQFPRSDKFGAYQGPKPHTNWTLMHQDHSNSNFEHYLECNDCHYQLAKLYWKHDYLAELGVAEKQEPQTMLLNALNQVGNLQVLQLNLQDSLIIDSRGMVIAGVHEGNETAFINGPQMNASPDIDEVLKLTGAKWVEGTTEPFVLSMWTSEGNKTIGEIAQNLNK